MLSTPHRLLSKHISGQSTGEVRTPSPPCRASTAPKAGHSQEHDVEQRVRRPAAQPAAVLAGDTEGEAAEAAGRGSGTRPGSGIHPGSGRGCALSRGAQAGTRPHGLSSMPKTSAAPIDCIWLKGTAGSLRGQCRHSWL